MNLTIQFFLVYLLLWVFVTTKQCAAAMISTMKFLKRSREHTCVDRRGRTRSTAALARSRYGYVSASLLSNGARLPGNHAEVHGPE